MDEEKVYEAENIDSNILVMEESMKDTNTIIRVFKYKPDNQWHVQINYQTLGKFADKDTALMYAGKLGRRTRPARVEVERARSQRTRTIIYEKRN